MVNVELEDTVPVRNTEGYRVLAGLAWDRRESRPNMRVQHRELELHVFDARVRLPCILGGVELGHLKTEDLQPFLSPCMLVAQDVQHTTLSLIV